MPLGNKEIGFYDDNYFDSVSQANRSLSYIQEDSELLKMLKINNNSKILDLGCGTRYKSDFFRRGVSQGTFSIFPKKR